MQDITIEELAGRSGLNEKFISEIERGLKNISINTLFKLAAGLDLKDPKDLLSEATQEVYPAMREKKE
jgi:transcriptional regulator with XRE-family HTH domain